MRKKLVSVLILNYNYAKYLRKAVESVASQTYSAIELIIIDDGSIDDSRKEIISIYNNFNNSFGLFKYLFLNKNRGKIHALNIGIQKIRGYFAIILDSDDYLSPNYIERTSELFFEEYLYNKNLGFVYTDCNLVDSNCKILERGKSTKFNATLLKTTSYIPDCGLTLTKALTEVAPLNENIKRGTKHHKWNSIVNKGYVGVYLPLPLFFYRMHENNLSGIGNKILNEIKDETNCSKILSGYWPLENS